MEIYKENLEKVVLENRYYRNVLFTTDQLQLVSMTIPTGRDIPMETHSKTSQFIRIEKGKGIAIVNKIRYNLKPGDSIIIPAGVKHYIKSTCDLQLYTIYSPPEHEPGLKAFL